MALQSYHYDDRCVFAPLLPDWDWELRCCTLGDHDDAAREGIHGALFTAMPSCKKPTAALHCTTCLLLGS